MIPCKWIDSFSYPLCDGMQNRDYRRLISKCKYICISKVIGKSTLRIFKYKFQLSFIFSLIHGTQVKTRLTVVMRVIIGAECLNRDRY